VFRSKLISICQNYHEYVHQLFGLFAFTISAALFPDYPVIYLLLVAIVASILPDIDHIFYFYIYGRRQKYATTVRSFVSKRQYHQALEYCRIHHKENYSIISHNLLTPILLIILANYFYHSFQPLFFTFCLSTSFHFVFDILEDLLVHGRLNPNWSFHFSLKDN